MGVDHGGGKIGMAQECLDSTDVRSTPQQVCRETVAKCMRRYALMDARPFCRHFNGFVDDGRIDVVPSGMAASGIPRQAP